MTVEKRGVVNPSETPRLGESVVEREDRRSIETVKAAGAEGNKEAAGTIEQLDDDLTKRLADKAAESL